MICNNLKLTDVMVPPFISKNATTDITVGFNNIVLRKAFTCIIKHESVTEGRHSKSLYLWFVFELYVLVDSDYIWSHASVHPIIRK
jgi:hypothetical protein